MKEFAGADTFFERKKLTLEPRYRNPIISDYAIFVPSVHAAVLAILEALGSRSLGIPAALPITISPEIFSATLRSGAVPMVLDIDSNFRINNSQVQTVIEELGNPVIISEGGTQQDYPDLVSIVINRCNYLVDLICISNIEQIDAAVQRRDYITVVDLGSCACILSKYIDLNSDIERVTSGILGHYSQRLLNDVSLALANTWSGYSNLEDTYTALASRLGIDLGIIDGKATAQVDDVDKTIAGMYLDDIETARGIMPLHYIPGIKELWAEKGASYPMAEKYSSKYIQLPFCAHLTTADITRILNSLQANI